MTFPSFGSAWMFGPLVVSLATAACVGDSPGEAPAPPSVDHDVISSAEPGGAPPTTTTSEGAQADRKPEAPPTTTRCATVTSSKTATVKVMTMNVRHDADQWERRFPMIADEIVRLDPDLIGLQEVELFADQADRLNDLIAARGHARYNVHAKIRSGVLGFFTGEGVAILSRWPIAERASLPMEDNRITLFARVSHPSGPKIDMAVTHLHHMSGDAADAMRLRQMNATTRFLEEHDDCHATFLVGDMNTGPESAPIRQLRSRGFIDSYREKHGDNTPKTGNTAIIKLEEGAGEQIPRRRIDYVFGLSAGARGVRVVDSIVGFRNHDAKGFYPSDHLGVMTTWTVGL